MEKQELKALNKEIISELKGKPSPRVIDDDATMKTLKAIYAKNKNFVVSEKKAYTSGETIPAQTLTLLSIANHPNVSRGLINKLSKHPDPLIKVAVSYSPFIGMTKSTELYQNVINQKGYGDVSVLLKAIFHPNITIGKRNEEIQKVYDKENLTLDDKDKVIFKNESNATNANIRGNIDGLYKVLTRLGTIADLTEDSINKIIASNHYGSLKYLSQNHHLSQGSYNDLVRYATDESERNAILIAEGLAQNEKLPSKNLAELTTYALQGDSLFALKSKYSYLAQCLTMNPSTPLQALLSLQSLHDAENTGESVEGDSEDSKDIPIGGTMGSPIELYLRVQEHPTYTKWVKETPDYKELLPPIKKCVEHTEM